MENKCDFLMIGWDPVPPIAGLNCNQSPESEVTREGD